MQLSTLQFAEQLALVAIVAFLPAIEAPKNIAVVLYLLFWALSRWRNANWVEVDGWDVLIMLLIFGAYSAATFGAFVPEKGAGAANDVLTYGLVFMAVRRSRFSPRFLWLLLSTIILATLLTLSYGYWELLIVKTWHALELNSVGHVNHGAIYIAIVFSVAFSWASCVSVRLRIRLLMGGAALMLWISLFVTQARGAIIPAILFLILWFALRVKSLQDFAKLCFVLAVIVVVAAIFIPGVLEKTKGGAVSGQLASYRPALAKTALLAVREYPLFGVGITNFGKIDRDLTDRWQEDRGQWFARGDLYFLSHAHNLYFNTLAERGIVGTLPLLLLLIGLGFILLRARPRNGSGALEQTLWGGAFGAWVLTSAGGVLNTTLHHEHALISVILIGLWMAEQTNSKQVIR